jgi:hypothetical protein
MDLVKAKTSFAFNRICINFLKEIKSRDINLKKKIKKNYKIYDKSSQEHIIYFWKKMEPVHEILQKDDIEPSELSSYIEAQLMNNEEFCDIYFLKGIQIGKLFSIFSNERSVILSYIMTLYLFGYLYNDINEESFNEIDTLLQTVLHVINSIDKRSRATASAMANEDSPYQLDNILDDTVKHIIELIKILRVPMIDESEKEKYNNNEFDSYSNLIDNSKIGSIAKDICSSLKDIDIDPNSTPEDLMANMFNGSNNVIGSLIEQVGSSLTQKINSGELNQDELIQDAFKLMGSLGNNSSLGQSSFMNDIMKNVMSSMGGTGGNTDMPEMPDFADLAQSMMGTGQKIDKNKVNQMTTNNKTKERLRRKLESKKSQEEVLTIENK